MSFTLPNIPMLTQEQASPFYNALQTALKVYGQGQDMQQKGLDIQKARELMPFVTPQAQQQLQQAILNNQKLGVEARYAEPNAQQALMKAQQYNEMYKPDLTSQIGLRNAQRKEQEALAGSHTSETQRQAFIQKQVSDILSGKLNWFNNNQINNNQTPWNTNQSTSTQPSSTIPQNGNAIQNELQKTQPNEQNNQQLLNNNQQINSTQNDNPHNLTYGQAEIISKYLGLPSPKIVDINGTQTALSAFGNIPLVQGLTPYQKSLQSGMGTYAAKEYGESVTSYNALSNQDYALDSMINEVQNNPEMRNVTGPIGSKVAKYLGTSAQKELYGKLISSSGEVSLQIAPSLKGAFTGRDQILLGTIKASPNDTYDVFIGKLKAQKLINSSLRERSDLRSRYLEQGMKPIEASKRAAQETPLDRLKPQIEEMIKSKNEKVNRSVGKVRNYNLQTGTFE